MASVWWDSPFLSRERGSLMLYQMRRFLFEQNGAFSAFHTNEDSVNVSHFNPTRTFKYSCVCAHLHLCSTPRWSTCRTCMGPLLHMVVISRVTGQQRFSSRSPNLISVKREIERTKHNMKEHICFLHWDINNFMSFNKIRRKIVSTQFYFIPTLISV